VQEEVTTNQVCQELPMVGQWCSVVHALILESTYRKAGKMRLRNYGMLFFLVILLTANYCARFLYALLVSIDANFKQKARSRPGDKNDPVLGPGFGCFVPNNAYMEEISKQADQDEVCFNFSPHDYKLILAQD
jgi:hypothetical protein